MDERTETPGSEPEPRPVGGSERHRALERKLGEAETRFRSIVDRSADGIVVVDGGGKVRFANPAARSLFSRSLEDLIGSDFGFPVVTSEIAEVDIVSADERPIIAELRSVETTWEDEPCTLVTLRDVTDRREAEERARELIREQAAREQAEREAERLSFLSEASRKLLSSLDPERVVDTLAGIATSQLADVACVELVELTGEGSGRVTCRVASAPALAEERQWLLEAMEKLRTGRRVAVDGALRTVRAMSGEEWIEASDDDELAGLRRELGPASVLVAPMLAQDRLIGTLTLARTDPDASFTPADRHVTEEIAGRAALAIENAELYRQAQRGNRAKESFLTIISHELRTPLTAITGYAGLLAEEIDGPLGDGQSRYVEGISRSADQLLRLIDQILVYTSLDSPGETPDSSGEDLSSMLDDVIWVVEPLARSKDLRIERRVPEAPLRVRTDGKKLRQILLNLVTNAVKFTEEGSVVLEVELDDGEGVFRVIDTGPGIPDDEKERVFEAFYQLQPATTRDVGGMGIGLSVVRRLTSFLGGTVEVDDRDGGGSVFTVRLPMQRTGGARYSPRSPEEAGE